MSPVHANVIEQLPPDLAALLERLDEGLRELYGERYRGLVLYGSYARGEADEGSDVDLLLLLDGEVNPTHEILRAEEVEWPLFMDTDYVVSLFPVSTTSYANSRQPFLLNARKEGTPLP